MEPFHRVVGGWYRKQVQKELVKYGLRYDDLLDPMMNLVSSALTPQSKKAPHSLPFFFLNPFAFPLPSVHFHL